MGCHARRLKARQQTDHRRRGLIGVPLVAAAQRAALALTLAALLPMQDGRAADAGPDGAASETAASEAAAHRHARPQVLAPGYADRAFEPPAPGSYRLPGLGEAADGAVLDASGSGRSLRGLMGDRLVLLSFIYTSCGDVNGCPLATHVFGRVADALREADDLRQQVRLLSLSFDPAGDPPAVMERYGRPHQRPGVDWQFLTTAGTEQLAPILDAYDQCVIRDVDESGEPLGTMSHVLRVYLIDRELKIRNIYSVSYLHPETILNDIRTVLLERADEP
jgi:cytochrome c peroxidase